MREHRLFRAYVNNRLVVDEGIGNIQETLRGLCAEYKAKIVGHKSITSSFYKDFHQEKLYVEEYYLKVDGHDSNSRK